MLHDPGPTILLGDDETALRQVLRVRLTARGFSICEASTGEDVLHTVPVLRPDVIVLDIGLPDIDGIEVTRRLRALVQTPIIILSVHSAESDKIAAVDAGADDYLTKPCDLGELLDRVRTALLRDGLPDSGVFCSGDLVVDLNRRIVRVADKIIRLTTAEYSILRILVLNAGRLLTQRRLAQEAGSGKGHEIATQTLRIAMSALREKLDANSAQSGHIATEPGVGYRLRIRPAN